jgi:hypothetical protein
MDAEIAKLTQKLLTKQGMKFKLNTKVMGGDDSAESVKINVEAAKGGKEEIVKDPVLNDCDNELTETASSMPMSFLLPSDAAHTLPV